MFLEKKVFLGRAQGPHLSLALWHLLGLSGGRSGPGPGHHNRSRNTLKSSDSYHSSQDVYHHFEMYFKIDKAKMSSLVLSIQEMQSF